MATFANFNPLRTLAGRLILVTIAAIAVSYAVVFALFANEREGTIRRQAESQVVERMVVTVDRMRGLDPEAQEEIAHSASDYTRRFWINDDAMDDTTGVAANRIAGLVSAELNGAQTRARVRIVEVEWPFRRFDSWRQRGRGGPEGASPDGNRLEQRAGRNDDRPRPSGQPPASRSMTEVTIDTQLAPERWLRLRAYLPGPRPTPVSVWYAALASVFAVGIGAALISRQIGKPLADLARAAERLGQGEPDAHAPLSGPDDVRRASAAFNAMADRLGRQMSRQRQMLWALSHDLRTPITALRLRAELIEDDSIRQRLLGPLEEMETMTEQALALARAGASEEARSSVDLAEIVRTLCGELQDMGVDIRAEADAPVFASCRPSEIARALRNLAENASRHGGGGVMTAARGVNGEAVVEVTDNGPGVSPDMLTRLTEPFFRADSARAHGAGLGLAIAQAIADGHGGRLVLANRTPHGFSATLILPG
jgi:signal transduction histidine kinase